MLVKILNVLLVDVSQSTIYGWKDFDKEPATKKKVSTITKGKHTKKGADTSPIHKTMNYLQIGVRRQDIQFKAKALLSKRFPDFKASSGSMDKFMSHHSLSVRKSL